LSARREWKSVAIREMNNVLGPGLGRKLGQRVYCDGKERVAGGGLLEMELGRHKRQEGRKLKKGQHLAAHLY